MENISEPGFNLVLLLYLLATVPFLILSVNWLMLPFLLISRPRKVHETLLRIE